MPSPPRPPSGPRNPSRGSDTGSSQASSSAFSRGVMMKLTELYADRCWVCSSAFPHACHVIGQEDRQASLWQDLGLMNFALGSEANAIPLCAQCHGHYDNALDPHLLIMPTDLNFFVEYELEDSERRRVAAGTGDTKRRVPSAEMYRQHLINKGDIGADSIGGLYIPVFLKQYMFVGVDPSLARTMLHTFTVPKSWHGPPVAMLRRALLVLGSPRQNVLSRETLDILDRLRKLYFLEEEENPPQDRLEQPPKKNNMLIPKKRSVDQSHTDTQPPSPKRRRDLQDSDGHTQDSQAMTYCPYVNAVVHAHWSLGPETSANDAISRFAPLLRQYPT
ncbi:hypothetical protein BO70DRAFT_89659 [Aspergillus heteromorphus CBS 117.55]|uniref:HNH nuclease domain-containing protein n=1 Tax=Aspergillus heteromorphus CBS 117.55 TaxID=1448321 RepID=A0A317WZ47_9EURO|nr:uncharacterized protein BO70DRAFT_89659 [Aspergillus heteromorphus CBS 117.55]PWY91285.1 hypothetical protein BO70DRAFT_89659 [Aspergillus heteromorphus CBS 117.55]